MVQLPDADRRELSGLADVEDGNYDSVQRIIVEVTIKITNRLQHLLF